ncbi:hypothetical protein SORBI_3001G469966 [Sorghum bicolor]|uniref:Uncharacterized protein n=1 Tax=Sorghum bicolor TaxID=4558 RepID=A0A1Z5SAZ4_SORBI|nr:hypothetical protein SORBI_3001G469966 [Sorghum bicolor]
MANRVAEAADLTDPDAATDATAVDLATVAVDPVDPTMVAVDPRQHLPGNLLLMLAPHRLPTLASATHCLPHARTHASHGRCGGRGGGSHGSGCGDNDGSGGSGGSGYGGDRSGGSGYGGNGSAPDLISRVLVSSACHLFQLRRAIEWPNRGSR